MSYVHHVPEETLLHWGEGEESLRALVPRIQERHSSREGTRDRFLVVRV